MHAQEVRDLAASSPAPIVPFKAEQVFEQAAIDAMDRVGRGKPLMVIKKGVATHGVDGAGVCSPGKWLPKDRRDVAPGFTRVARKALHGGVMRWCAALGREPRQVLFALAAGQHGGNDVLQAITEELSKELHSLAGHGWGGQLQVREGHRSHPRGPIQGGGAPGPHAPDEGRRGAKAMGQPPHYRGPRGH